tara:strand:- start:31 stop:1164 length:1134 start_codon:yes stop_codon:yes gene_type:complete
MLIDFLGLISIFSYSIIIIVLSKNLINYKNSLLKINNTNGYLPFVSVVIAARNEEKNIKPLIKSLLKQSYPKNKFEVIIINDRSTDNTLKILNQSKTFLSQLLILNVKATPIGWAAKKWALKCGIDQSNGEIILQTDADCIVPQKWIEKIVTQFSDKSVGFVAAPSPMGSSNSLIDKLFFLDSMAQDAISASGFLNNIALTCSGRNISFRKAIYNHVDGYVGTESIPSGDDDLLMHKIYNLYKYKMIFLLSKDVVVLSDPPKTFKQFLLQRMRFASKGLLYYKIDTNTIFRLILPLILITNIFCFYFLICFLNNPTIYLLILFIIKNLADLYITYNYHYSIDQPFSFLSFSFLSIIHPIYIITFGIIGSLINVRWKN